MDRLARKTDTARKLVPPSVVDGKGAKIGLLAYGTTHHAIVETRDQLRAEEGIATDYLRVRGFPFDAAVRPFLEAHERTYVVEQNRDAQMLQLLRLEFPDLATRLVSVRNYDGLPIDARTVTDQIVAAQKAGVPAASTANPTTAPKSASSKESAR
jgi:2-oxoglutarate ferredoxin oxidoreductase subunit alpha